MSAVTIGNNVPSTPFAVIPENGVPNINHHPLSLQSRVSSLAPSITAGSSPSSRLIDGNVEMMLPKEDPKEIIQPSSSSSSSAIDGDIKMAVEPTFTIEDCLISSETRPESRIRAAPLGTFAIMHTGNNNEGNEEYLIYINARNSVMVVSEFITKNGKIYTSGNELGDDAIEFRTLDDYIAFEFQEGGLQDVSPKRLAKHLNDFLVSPRKFDKRLRRPGELVIKKLNKRTFYLKMWEPGTSQVTKPYRGPVYINSKGYISLDPQDKLYLGKEYSPTEETGIVYETLHVNSKGKVSSDPQNKFVPFDTFLQYAESLPPSKQTATQIPPMYGKAVKSSSRSSSSRSS